jgi:glycosyltransferase involved in cell wall biosynthesis
VAVIPNGIKVPNALDPEWFWSHYPGLRSRRVVLFLSRLHYKKGVDVLCRAWAAVTKKHPDAHLVLAGPDSEGTRYVVERLIGELGLQDTVTFTGMLKGNFKWGALAASEVFVLPSYSEGFSVATLEAMAAGKPVIISRQCYFPEVARQGCGWVIEPCEKDLADALFDCLSNGSRDLSEMGERGRRLVSSRYSWDVIGAQMADVYDWLLGGPKPTSVEIID